MIKFNKNKVSIIAGVISAVAIITSPAVVSAAVSSASTTITATLGSAITISSGENVAISLTPTANGVVSSASDSVTVSTNNTAGYTLTLADTDTNTSLTSADNSIAAHTGTFAEPSVLAGNSWGYAIAGGAFTATYASELNVTDSTTKWAGVPSSAAPQQLKSTSSTASNDATTVWYGVRAASTQASGTYADQVTYTATTN